MPEARRACEPLLQRGTRRCSGALPVRAARGLSARSACAACRSAFHDARNALRAQVADAAAGAGADAGGEEVSLVAGRLQVDVAATNLQPVPLALLKVPPRAAGRGPGRACGPASATASGRAWPRGVVLDAHAAWREARDSQLFWSKGRKGIGADPCGAGPAGGRARGAAGRGRGRGAARARRGRRQAVQEGARGAGAGGRARARRAARGRRRAHGARGAAGPRRPATYPKQLQAICTVCPEGETVQWWQAP